MRVDILLTQPIRLGPMGRRDRVRRGAQTDQDP